MTDQEPSGGDERPTDITARRLAALGLVRLWLRDDRAQFSMELLTDTDGHLDFMVVEELILLAAGLTHSLADASGVAPETMLDRLVRRVVEDSGRDQH
jgi:hypothetical protein